MLTTFLTISSDLKICEGRNGLYISSEDFIPAKDCYSVVFLACSERLSVHLRTEESLKEKLLIPPVVLASRFIVCSPLWSIAVRSMYPLCACTESPLYLRSSFSPGYTSAVS